MTTVIFIIGASAFVAGCVWLSPPLGLIVGGAMTCLFAYGLARGET